MATKKITLATELIGKLPNGEKGRFPRGTEVEIDEEFLAKHPHLEGGQAKGAKEIRDALNGSDEATPPPPPEPPVDETPTIRRSGSKRK